MQKRFRVGTAGSPGRSTLEGILIVRENGLNAMEVEFVYGCRMTNALAKQVGKSAEENNIALSVHAPYYINLASKEKTKQTASRIRILRSCERAHHMKARKVVFHAAMYQQREPEDVYNIVREQMKILMKEIRKRKLDVELAPEITGKLGQFGSLDELLRLKKDTGCSMCVDFAHLIAREQGKINYSYVLKKLPQKLHIHWSGIAYTAKGEKNHKLIDMKQTKTLLKWLKKNKKTGTIICESPDTLNDALKIKNVIF